MRIVLPSLARLEGLMLDRIGLISVVLLVDEGCKTSLEFCLDALRGSSVVSLPLILSAVCVACYEVSRANSFG